MILLVVLFYLCAFIYVILKVIHKIKQKKIDKELIRLYEEQKRAHEEALSKVKIDNNVYDPYSDVYDYKNNTYKTNEKSYSDRMPNWYF